MGKIAEIKFIGRQEISNFRVRFSSAVNDYSRNPDIMNRQLLAKFEFWGYVL